MFSQVNCLLSLCHFIVCCGNVKNIQLDNRPNLIGTEKELKAAINKIDTEKVMIKIIKKGVHFSWKFKPSSPWMRRA